VWRPWSESLPYLGLLGALRATETVGLVEVAEGVELDSNILRESGEHVRTFEVSDRERVKPSPRGGTTSLPAALREVKTSGSGEIKISFGPNCSRFLRTSSSLGASHWLFSAPQRPDSENRSHLFHNVQTRRSRSIDNRRIKRSERTKEVDELGDSKGPYHQTDYKKYTNKSESTRRHERLLKIEFAASPGAIWNWGNLHSHLAGSAIQFRHSCSVESASVVCRVRSCIVTIPLRGFTKYRFNGALHFPAQRHHSKRRRPEDLRIPRGRAPRGEHLRASGPAPGLSGAHRRDPRSDKRRFCCRTASAAGYVSGGAVRA
jgi:hypothetical protein